MCIYYRCILIKLFIYVIMYLIIGDSIRDFLLLLLWLKFIWLWFLFFWLFMRGLMWMLIMRFLRLFLRVVYGLLRSLWGGLRYFINLKICTGKIRWLF